MSRRLTRHSFVRGRAARRADELRLADAIDREIAGLAPRPAPASEMGGGMAEPHLRSVPAPIAAPAPPAPVPVPREERAPPEKIDLRNVPSSMEMLADSWRRR